MLRILSREVTLSTLTKNTKLVSVERDLNSISSVSMFDQPLHRSMDLIICALVKKIVMNFTKETLKFILAQVYSHRADP